MEDAYTRSIHPAADEAVGKPSATPTSRPTREAPPSPLEEAVLRLVRLTLGAAGLGLALASSVIRAAEQEPGEQPADEGPRGGVELAARAAFGLAMEAQRRGIEAIVGAGLTMARASSLALGSVPLPWWRDRLRSALTAWGDRGAEEQAGNQAFAAEVLSDVLRRTTAAILDRIDLNQLAARIDVEALVDRVDVNRIVEGIDLNAIADGIDVERIVGRVDLNELVARVDVDRIVEGIDVEAIVRRLDLAGIAKDVMNELQVDEIIRESAGSLAVETVDAVRVQGVSADTFVSHFVDRLLGRKDGRELGLGGPADGDGS